MFLATAKFNAFVRFCVSIGRHSTLKALFLNVVKMKLYSVRKLVVSKRSSINGNKPTNSDALALFHDQ